MWQGRARLASLLWIALAVVVWNVVFDRVLVVAGRRYARDASLAARRGEPYLKIDDYMRPAARRAVQWATLSAGGVALAGLLGVKLAAARDERLKASGATSGLPRRS